MAIYDVCDVCCIDAGYYEKLDIMRLKKVKIVKISNIYKKKKSI